MLRDFNKWLDTQLEARNWTRSDLARRANVSQSVLSMIYSEARSPGPEVLTAIAGALHVPPEIVFRIAGLLPAAPEDRPDLEELSFLYLDLPPADQVDLLDYARFKARAPRVDTPLIYQITAGRWCCWTTARRWMHPRGR